MEPNHLPAPHQQTESAPGARCGLHPQQEALVTCGRCGGFACAVCAAPEAARYQRCGRCWEEHRLDPLPWQRSFTPLAFLRTVLRWTYTPRKAAREFTRPSGAGRAVVFGALSLTIFLLCMGSLSEVSQSWRASQPGVRHAPGYVAFASDIAKSVLWRPASLGFLVTTVFLFDLLVFALRKRMRIRQILASWGYGLAPLATWVVPTLLCWAALRDQWFTGRLRWWEILWLTCGPILVTVGVLNV